MTTIGGFLLMVFQIQKLALLQQKKSDDSKINGLFHVTIEILRTENKSSK